MTTTPNNGKTNTGKTTTGKTATVEVLTAEVRVLMVSGRQVTLSVYRQLDEVEPNAIEPFGRVRDSRREDNDEVQVMGRHGEGGSLVRSKCVAPRQRFYSGSAHEPYWRWRADEAEAQACEPIRDHTPAYDEAQAIFEAWSALPLIVLAEDDDE